MSPEEAKSIVDFLAERMGQESPVTRRVLSSLPDSKLSWQPHEKGRTAGQLAWHIVASEIWFLQGIAAGQFAAIEEESGAPSSIAEMLAYYDKHFPNALAAVKALSAEQCARCFDFFGMNFPAAVYTNFAMVHSIHHRGQMAAYLRAMGERVPDIYGGSADEPFQQQTPTA